MAADGSPVPARAGGRRPWNGDGARPTKAMNCAAASRAAAAAVVVAAAAAVVVTVAAMGAAPTRSEPRCSSSGAVSHARCIATAAATAIATVTVAPSSPAAATYYTRCLAPWHRAIAAAIATPTAAPSAPATAVYHTLCLAPQHRPQLLPTRRVADRAICFILSLAKTALAARASTSRTDHRQAPPIIGSHRRDRRRCRHQRCSVPHSAARSPILLSLPTPRDRSAPPIRSNGCRTLWKAGWHRSGHGSFEDGPAADARHTEGRTRECPTSRRPLSRRLSVAGHWSPVRQCGARCGSRSSDSAVAITTLCGHGARALPTKPHVTACGSALTAACDARADGAAVAAAAATAPAARAAATVTTAVVAVAAAAAAAACDASHGAQCTSHTQRADFHPHFRRRQLQSTRRRPMAPTSAGPAPAATTTTASVAAAGAAAEQTAPATRMAAAPTQAAAADVSRMSALRALFDRVRPPRRRRRRQCSAGGRARP